MNNETEVTEEEKLKKYTKLINFYKIAVDPSFGMINKTEFEALYEVLNSTFTSQDLVTFEDIAFEKISIDKNHFFGCIHRNSTIDILTEIKSKSDITIESEDIILESSTYFYVDFNYLGMSVIKTQKIPNPERFIEKLIYNKSALNITMAPFKKSDKEIKNLLATSFVMTFCSDDFVELKNINKADCEFKEYTLSAKLKNSSPEFIRKLLEYKNNSSLKKLSVSTNTEDVDLIKNIFTKQVSIELTKNYKNDLNKIKNTLSNELLKIINT